MLNYKYFVLDFIRWKEAKRNFNVTYYLKITFLFRKVLLILVFFIMTLTMTFYVISANLNVCSNEMVQKAMFESIKSGQSLLKKKKTFSEKAKYRAVIKFCAGIGKTPTKANKHLKRSVGHRNLNRFLVFKWHISFSDRRENLIMMDDVQEGRPSYRNCRAKWSSWRYWCGSMINSAWCCRKCFKDYRNGRWHFIWRF